MRAYGILLVLVQLPLLAVVIKSQHQQQFLPVVSNEDASNRFQRLNFDEISALRQQLLRAESATNLTTESSLSTQAAGRSSPSPQLNITATLQQAPKQVSIVHLANVVNQTTAPPSLDAREAFDNISYVGNDDSLKELIDYDNSYIDALDFGKSVSSSENLVLINQHHEDVHKYLLELNQKYPLITRLYSIGNSVEGRPLWALELSENPGVHKPLKPQVRYAANIHGNEVVGRELLLQFARLLAENYNVPQDQLDHSEPTPQKFVNKLLANTTIYILPSINPDGYARSKVSCKVEPVGRRGRINANNVDLNRNFPDLMHKTEENAATQPEVKAVMEWAGTTNTVLGINFHGGALVASYPYDGLANLTETPTYSKSPDDDLYRHLASTYAKDHENMANGKECFDKCVDDKETKFIGGITNGAEWYPIYGSMQDWLYENTNSFEITVEVGCDMHPEAGKLSTYWKQNKRALVNYIKEAHKGIKGLVYEVDNDDEGKKKPLANVMLHVAGSHHKISTSQTGEYFRPLLDGLHQVTFSKEGYTEKTVEFRYEGTMAQRYDITLSKVGDTITVRPEQTQQYQSSDHSILVSILVMSIVTCLILLALGGAYIAQKRRTKRSQTMQLQTIRKSDTTASISIGRGHHSSASGEHRNVAL